MLLFKNKSGITKVQAALAVIIIIVIVAVGAYYYSMQMGPAQVSTETMKVALVSIGGPATTWNKASVEGINDAATLLEQDGVAKLEITTKLDVTPADAARVFSDYAEAGYDLVIGDSVIYESALKQVAPDYPDTYFLGVAWMGDLRENLAVYGWNMWEGYYPAGVVAGLATDTNVIGFVTAFEFEATATMYNAFAQGAKSVNPDIKVLYAVTSDWSDPTKGASAAQALIAEGADVIAGCGDGMTDGVIKQCESSNALAMGYMYDQNDLAPNTVITSVVWYKTRYFNDAVRAIVNNEYAYKEFNYGIKDQIVGLAPYHTLEDVLTADERAHVENVLNEMYEGTLTPEYIPEFPPQPT